MSGLGVKAGGIINRDSACHSSTVIVIAVLNRGTWHCHDAGTEWYHTSVGSTAAQSAFNKNDDNSCAPVVVHPPLSVAICTLGRFLPWKGSLDTPPGRATKCCTFSSSVRCTFSCREGFDFDTPA